MKNMKEDLYFRCDCGHAGFVCFHRDDSFWGKGAVVVEVINKPGRLSYRIRHAIRHIFKGGKLYQHDIILGKKDVNKLRKYLHD